MRPCVRAVGLKSSFTHILSHSFNKCLTDAFRDPKLSFPPSRRVCEMAVLLWSFRLTRVCVHISWSPLLLSIREGENPGAVSQPLGPGLHLRPRLPPGCSCPAFLSSPKRPSRSPAHSFPAASPHSHTRGLRDWTHFPVPCAGSAAQSWQSPG